MDGLNFDLAGNSESIIAKVEQVRVAIQSTLSELQKEGGETTNVNNKLSFSFKETWEAIDGTAMLKKFVSDVVKVRGEFQQLETSFSTLLQDKGEVDALMSQMMKMATETPFSVTELATGAQQLLTYGMQADEVNNTLVQLGNIASGSGLPLERLVSIYGTVMSQGSLCAGDLEQFAASGVPMLQGLADMYGVTTAKVNEMVSAGQIGFPEVQTVIGNLTNEGGRFYNLMEQQSNTLTGKIDNLGDSWNIMLNKIGQSQEGVIGGSLDSVKYLVDNYEEFGRVLIGLISVYGTYKAAAMLAIATANGYTISQIAQYNILLLVEKAQKALNFTVLKNPYVIAAVAVVGLVSAMWALTDHTSTAEKEQEKLNEKTKRYNEQLEDEKKKINGLLAILQDETATQKDKSEAFKELQKMMPSVYGTYKTEKELLDNLIEARKKENEEIRIRGELMNVENMNKSVNKLNELKRLKELEKVGETGRIRQGTQFEYQNLYSSNGIRKEKGFFQSNASYIDELIEITSQQIGNGQNIIRKQEQTAWESTLNTMSRATAEGQKKMYQGYKILLTQSGKEWIQIEGSTSPINGQIIADRISQLNREVLLVEEKDAAQYQDEAKKAWNEAKKEVENVKSSKIKYRSPEQFEDALSKAQQNENSAKKTYESRGGVAESTNENQTGRLREQEESYNQLLSKQAHDRIRSEQDLQNQIEQARINAMKEGSVRTLAQMKLDHDKEKQQLARQKEDALASAIEDERAKFEANPKNKDSAFNASDIKLSKPQADGFAKQESYLRQEQANDIENYYKSLHEGYQDYTDQRLAIEEKYNNDIATLQEARKKYEKEGDTEKVQQTDRSIAQATKGKGTALMGLDYEQLKQSPEYVRAFENLKYTSSETLNSLLNQLENAKSSAAKVLSPDQLREYTTTIQDIMDELDERNPFQSLIDKKEELALAEEMVAQAQVELENARQQSEDVKSGKQVMNGVSTKYNQETGKIDSTKVYLSESQALANVKDRLDKYNQAKDNVVEKTDKVKVAEQKAKDVIDDLSQSISSLGASIEGPAGEIISLIGEIGSFTMMAMGGIDVASKTASTAIQTVEKASVILAIIGAAIQIGMKIAELFNKDDKKEKKIEQLQDQIDVLDKAYEKLGDSIEKAYSTDASKLISQQNEILEQQKVLIQNQMLEEKSKKKPDDGRIKELGDQIDSINKQIGQNEEKKIDIVLGSDAKSAIDEFAQAYADAWATGNDRAKSSKDLVKDMIKQMVMEAIKMTSSEPMQKLRERLKEFFSDGIISAWEREQIEKDAEAITKDLDGKYSWADEYMKGDEESNSQEGSTKGGFETMSQETGSELNGRFTALQISNEEIRNSMLLVLGNLSSLCTTTSDGNILLTEMRNLAVMSNGHLEDIAKHTKVLLGFGDKLDKIEKNTHGL